MSIGYRRFVFRYQRVFGLFRFALGDRPFCGTPSICIYLGAFVSSKKSSDLYYPHEIISIDPVIVCRLTQQNKSPSNSPSWLPFGRTPNTPNSASASSILGSSQSRFPIDSNLGLSSDILCIYKIVRTPSSSIP